MKLYICDQGDMMIYDHQRECACWGEKFYFVTFSAIKKYWTYVGEY